MNKYVATAQVIPIRTAAQLIASGDRAAIVKSMAEHLAAAVIADGLELTNSIDVIDTLWRTPEQWQARVILNHLDDAVYECEQILIAKQMGDI